MANYAVDPSLLDPYLPHGVEMDEHNGKCYLSLVGFLFETTHLFNIPFPFAFTFEEVNLRFYVRRKVGDQMRRGVVFINETVPFRIIARVANTLYREHYTAVPTKHSINISPTRSKIRYEWKKNKKWDHLGVESDVNSREMQPGSLEEFIFEHYYGYTRINDKLSQEYRIQHPRWRVNTVLHYSVHCDFAAMYGEPFAFLTDTKPDAVFLAEGSPVNILWRRTRF